MARRKVLKITPVLVTLNILVLLLMVLYFGGRLIKYYNIEHGTTNKSNGSVLFVDAVLKNQKFVDLTEGLIYNEAENNYMYKGKVDNNYLLYSGILFRIVGVDNENNVKAISDEGVTLLYSGLEKGYNDSFVNKWLNKTDADYSGVFESELYNSETLLANTSLCSDVIADVNNITCENINFDNKIGLLTINDYKNAGGANSYLNNGENYYLATLDDSNGNYYVTSSGEIGINQMYTKLLSVRPVISISSSAKLISGKGSKTNPYIIENHDIKTANDIYVNNYIKFNDEVYKVVAHTSDGIKVAGTKVIMSDEKEYTTSYGSNNKFTTSITIGKYLNNTLYNSFENKDLIVSNKWYVGALSLNGLDYANAYKISSKANVGMLGIGDLYVGEIKNIFTISRGIESSNIINIINEDGNVFADEVSSKHNVRAAFVIKKDASVVSGKGTISDPYVLGGSNEEE